MAQDSNLSELIDLSRRDLLTTGTSLAALAAAGCSAAQSGAGTVSLTNSVAHKVSPSAPFDNMRDWIAALDANGLLLTVDRIDQDDYEATALFYRATDRFGMFNAPAMRFNNVKINGQWMKGPVFANLQGNWQTDALIWGLPLVPGDGPASYREAKAYMTQILVKNNGAYPSIPPMIVARERAPCKEVVLRGDEIDLTKFPFLQTNPHDAGRYINTGSIFTHDPQMGGNYGTYRCQLKGPRLIGLNPEHGQTGWKMLTAAKERGEPFAHVSIALGQDPVMWFISSTRVVPRRGEPIDELAVAGGFLGKPLPVIKSETNDMLIPANAEMIIEGEVPLQQGGMPEGPFGEMFGYMGPFKKENFFVNVTTVTHRRNPWIVNAFTGMQRGMVIAPMDALYEYSLRKSIPYLVEMHQPQDLMGVAIMSIDKTAPGQGLEAGKLVAQRNPICKVIIVVDKDVDVINRTDVLFALGSRWQPYPASYIINDIGGIVTDPSERVQGRTSKIVIDATRQLSSEGGREHFPETNRALLIREAPGVFEKVDRKFSAVLDQWKPV